MNEERPFAACAECGDDAGLSEDGLCPGCSAEARELALPDDEAEGYGEGEYETEGYYG